MPWECPECHASVAEGFECVQCGYVKTPRIVLRSLSGKIFKTIIDCKIDRAVYKQLGGNDYEYLSPIPGSFQFELIRSPDLPMRWGIKTSNVTSLNTLLNDGICEKDNIYPLYEGDVIKLGSKKNPASTAAPLTVSFEG